MHPHPVSFTVYCITPQTMLIYVFSPHMPPLLRFCRFGCKTKHSATQAGLNALYVGPDFHHSIRYPQISVVVFVSMVYSSGIPLLYLVIAAAAFTFYWTDKYLFTRWYRTPPQYDAQISLQFSGYLPYAALLHVVFGSWMLANRRMFSSPSLADDSSAASDDGETLFHQQLVQYIGDPGEQRYNIISCLLQDHMGPMLTALVVLLGYLVFFELIWHVVGPPLRRCLRAVTCNRCGGHSVVVLKDDFINEEEHMKQYGLASYNIFENPIYMMMFNVGDDYGETHVHLESLQLGEIVGKKKASV